MSTDTNLETLVRSRLKSMRLALGWSLDELARRTQLGVSTLSRIETGNRTIGIDVLQLLCRALQTDIGALLAVSEDHDDVVIRPVPATAGGRTVWRVPA